MHWGPLYVSDAAATARSTVRVLCWPPASHKRVHSVLHVVCAAFEDCALPRPICLLVAGSLGRARLGHKGAQRDSNKDWVADARRAGPLRGTTPPEPLAL